MTEHESPDTATQTPLAEQHAPIAWRTPIHTSVVYASEHESLAKRPPLARDFVVSRSKDRGRAWTLTRDGRFAASFATYEDALEVAKHWARQAFERDGTREVRVMVEWVRSRLDIEARFQPEAARLARSA